MEYRHRILSCPWVCWPSSRSTRPMKISEIHSIRILECEPTGSKLRSERDALDLISAALEHRAAMVTIPVARLDDDFFRLKTGVAGALLQKFVNYQVRVAIVGDASHFIEKSEALRDFVRESNRGAQFWFVADRDELEQRIAG